MAGLAEILDENTHLRSLVQAQAEQAEANVKLLEELRQQVEALKASNELYAKHFQYLEDRRKLAAAERFIADQRQAQLFEGGEVEIPPRDPKVEEEDAKRAVSKDGRKTAKHKRKGRRDLSKLDFEKKKVIAPVTEASCGSCGGQLEVTGTKVVHRIGWEPGHFTVHEVHLEQCSCNNCSDNAVWTAPQPYLLPSSMCDDGLLTRVIVDKFGDHIPLHRQAKRMTREGFPIGSNVLSTWVCSAFKQAQPLVKAVMLQVASSSLLMSDDSGFPVQDGEDGKLANGRLWVVTDQKQAFMSFSRTKEGESPAALFASLNISGRLVVDGGSEYNKAVLELGLDRGGCWSHLRRYFFEAAIQHDDANVGLTAIHDLFMIERDLVDLPVDQRLIVRQQRSRPLVDGFYSWVKSKSPGVRPKSKFGRALGYAINQEERMRLFLSHGDVPLHNNLSELLLRQPIVGRKNWLFARSEGGAEAAAGWFTLISSCLLQGIDPAAYLYDVFRRLPDYPSKWIHELTPLNWRLAVEAGDFIPKSPGQLG